MATEGGGTNRSPPTGVYPSLDDPNPLKTLYPMVNEKETPLPRAWSMKDKYSFIGLSQNNLRVHYKASPATGHGKTHKDAASVRATHPIPASCGLYYFEIRVVSKGRGGYMGIGLSAQGVSMNRLPGWDRNSYGYHGDDGHSFCSTGSGQPYGPTFTTGDVVGCGLNLVDRTCFYTKNGVMLGTAFSDLSDQKLLYPTVGLQTPGEIIDANFGLSGPFVFDLRIKMGEIREKVRKSIIEHPITLGETVISDNGDKGRWNDVLHKMVSGYLVHHGYSNTAEAFSRATHMSFNEEIASIKNRQRISNLIMTGDVGGAIAVVQQLYPDLLELNKNLLFLLKVRQFIEIVNGTEQDCEAQCTNGEVPSKVHHTSVIQSTKAALAKGNITELNRNTRNSSEPRGSNSRPYIEDSDSEMMEFTEENRTQSNSSPKACSEDRAPSNGVSNGFNKHAADSQEDTTDLTLESNGVGEGVPYLFTAMKGYSEEKKKKHVDNVLTFGRELQSISLDLKKTQGKNKSNKKMLQDAFSLLAYTDPANSPVGWQLNPSMREPVCQALNSAILELQNLPARPALEVSAGHAQQLIEVMLKCCMGSAALTNLPNILNYQPKPFVPAREDDIAKETSSSDVSNLDTTTTTPPNISSSTSSSNLSLKNSSTRTTISSSPSGEKRSAASLSGNEYYSCSGDGSGLGVLGTSSSFPPSVVDTALRQRNFSNSYHQDFILNSSTPVDFQASDSQDMEHAPADFYQPFPSTSSYSTDNSDYYYSYMSSDNQTDLASTSYLSNSGVAPHYHGSSSTDHIGSMSMTSAALTSASATLVASGTSLDDVEPLESEALEPMERLETMALGGGGGSLSLGAGTVSSSESSSTTSSTAQLTFSQHDSIDGSSMSESHWLPSNDQ